MIHASLSERFLAKVDKRGPLECWPWTAFVNPKGYGLAHVRMDLSMAPAHRIAWELANGSLPEGKVVCHSCDNPPCCNPNHLFLGTQADNVADMVAKNRQRSGSKPGRVTSASKLNLEQVREIRARYACGDSQRNLASEFAVSQTSISEIINRKTWGVS